MNLQITALYRSSDIANDPSKPAGIHNMGGGVTVQRWNLAQAIPNIHITSNIEEAGDICITEALWFFDTENEEQMDILIEKWSELQTFKILINNDLTLGRMKGKNRERIIEATDIVATTSVYAQQLLNAFADDVVLMYDPIDTDMFKPTTKSREIFGAGQICLEKNTAQIAQIFAQIPHEAGLTKTYLGSHALWGTHSRPELNEKLEELLYNVCDNLKTNIPYMGMPTEVAKMWAYVSDTRYDFSSISMLEAMACGCWLITGRHLMYNDRPCRRFNDSTEAVNQILLQLQETPPESGIINEEARQYVVDRNSYDAFRRGFYEMVGRVNIGI